MSGRMCCLIGLEPSQATVLTEVLALYRSKGRIGDWEVSVGWIPGADLLICDIDSAAGKHAWRWCKMNDTARVAVTATPLGVEGYYLSKPLNATELPSLIAVLNECDLPDAATADGAAQSKSASDDDAHGSKQNKPALRLAWSQADSNATVADPSPTPAALPQSPGPGGGRITVHGGVSAVAAFDSQTLPEASQPGAPAAAPSQHAAGDPSQPEILARAEFETNDAAVVIPHGETVSAPMPFDDAASEARQTGNVEVSPAMPPAEAPSGIDEAASSAAGSHLHPDADTSTDAADAPVVQVPPDELLPLIDLADFLVAEGPEEGREVENVSEPHVAFETFVPSSSIGQFKQVVTVTVADDDRIRAILQGIRTEPNKIAVDRDEELYMIIARLRSIRRVAVLHFEKLEPICIAVTEQAYFSKASLREIEAAIAIDTAPARHVMVETVSIGIREAGCQGQTARPLSQLAWVAALHCRAPDVSLFQGRAYKLGQWPDLVQLPHAAQHMRWCGLLTRRSATLAALQDAVGATPEEVAAFLSACGELGILERTVMSAEAVAKVVEPATEKARDRISIFRSFLNRLGLRGS